jgi:hypothetical protein
MPIAILAHQEIQEVAVTTRSRLAWNRLQTLLEGLHPGDALQLNATAKQTGLDLSSCETVLEALARIDLFTRTENQTYVRRRMLEPLERRHL